MQKIELEISAISHSAGSNTNYSIVLEEKNGRRRLPIIIGAYEAQAIALAMEKMTTNRPLTHDLFRNVFDTLGVEMREVVISELVDGIFHSLLVCEFNGVIETIDSRTSDAIALALRFNCPIFSYESIMESSSIEMEDPAIEIISKPENKKAGWTKYSVSELKSLLDESLTNEDYRRAAEIRDELTKR